MLSDYFLLALKGLRNRKIRSWLTMMGIFIGIAAVVSLISLGQGLKQAIVSQFTSAGSDKLLVQASGVQYGPPGTGVITPLQDKDAQTIKRVTGVKEIAERLVRMAKMNYRGTDKFVLLENLPTDKSRQLVLDSIKIEPESGRLLTVNDKNKIVVGNDWGNKKIFSKKLIVGDKVKINDTEFEIVGIAKRMGSIGGNQVVFMNDGVMKDLLGISDQIDLMSVSVQPDADINLVADEVKQALRRSRNVVKGKEDFTVQTPTQAAEALEKVLSYAQWFLVGIAFISIVVGGVGIMNTMYTSVLERRKEIGIMKSIGARNEHIFTLFLIESGILGMLGGIIGILLGVVLSQLIVVGMTAILGPGLIQAQYSMLLILGALGFSFMVGSIAGTLPALQASKLNPVDALRK